MAISKIIKREWPYNNAPSKLHQWIHIDSNSSKCERCGSIFLYKAGGRSPVHCFPTPIWLKDNPKDFGKSG